MIDLLVGDDPARAVDVLLSQAIPVQDDVLLLLSEMLSYQQEAARGEFERALEIFSDVVERYPELRLAALHLKRLRSGQTGSTVLPDV